MKWRIHVLRNNNINLEILENRKTRKGNIDVTTRKEVFISPVGCRYNRSHFIHKDIVLVTGQGNIQGQMSIEGKSTRMQQPQKMNASLLIINPWSFQNVSVAFRETASYRNQHILLWF